MCINLIFFDCHLYHRKTSQWYLHIYRPLVGLGALKRNTKPEHLSESSLAMMELHNASLKTLTEKIHNTIVCWLPTIFLVLSSHLAWTGSWHLHHSESSWSSLRSGRWWCQRQIVAQPPSWEEFIKINYYILAIQKKNNPYTTWLTSRLLPPILEPKSALPTLKSPWSLSRMSFTTSSRACCK